MSATEASGRNGGSAAPHASPSPRIAPATREQMGTVNWVVTRVIGLATGGAPPRVFTTLARHRRMFLPWLRFAGTLMPRGKLPRKDSELVILRVAHVCGCEYERRHHERIGRQAGLSAEEVDRTLAGPDAAGWTSRQAALLRAVDELLEDKTLSDERWAELRPLLSDEQLLELCMLTGHYAMLAMTINAARVEPDDPGQGGAAWLSRLAGLRGRGS